MSRPIARHQHSRRRRRTSRSTGCGSSPPSAPSRNRVRPSILASWYRSRDMKVAADRIELPYLRDPDIDTPLSRSAEPILKRLHEQLDGQAVSIVLTDPTGLVLSRRTADADLERHLDQVLLAPGFSYAEQFVGTNGIGTALEAGAATQVFGHEHYAENLEDLACAGVPIHDPISGPAARRGRPDLLAQGRRVAAAHRSPRATAEQIQQALLTDSSLREYRVLQAYRQTCRRTTGIVFALTGDAVMLNDHARTDLRPSRPGRPAGARAEASAAHRGAGAARSIAVHVADRHARRGCTASRSTTASSRPGWSCTSSSSRARRSAARTRGARRAGWLLPGLVGRVAAVAAGLPRGRGGDQRQQLAGARGRTGRRQARAAARGPAAAAAATRGSWCSTPRGAAADRNWARDSPHGARRRRQRDRLARRRTRRARPPLASPRRCEDVEARPERRVWVAVTLQPGARQRRRSTKLLRSSPRPSRCRRCDCGSRTSPHSCRSCSASWATAGTCRVRRRSMRLLMRSTWPGNVAQLQQLLHKVVQRRRARARSPPRTCRRRCTPSAARVLSPLESLERDAIVQSLADANGNKVQAARALGMSRATIYRKIHEFGIVTPS